MIGARPLTEEEIDLTLSKGFTGTFSLRNQTLFTLGLDTGFRIGSLLTVKISDIVSPNGEIKTHLEIKKKFMKGKTRGHRVLIGERSKKYLQLYISVFGLKGDDYLFRSREGGSLSVSQSWRVFEKAFNTVGIFDWKGTHCMRKTFSKRFYFKSGKDILLTSKALGHKYITSTQSYLPVDEGEIDDVLKKLF